MKTAYFILGMHRSGTSAIGGVLSLMGLEFGTELMKPNQDNPKGFFENYFVYQLNQKILMESGSSWDDYSFRVTDIKADKIRGYVQEAKKIIESEYRFSQQFAIKDPRICLLFPIWEEACLELDIHIKIIIPYRNPLEVAQSLKNRNSFSYEKSLLLWTSYFMSAESLTRDYDRVFISFDDLLKDTKDNLLILEAFINLNLNEDILNGIGIFLDKNIKHSNIRLENFTKEIPSFLQKTIQLLQEKTFEESEKIDFIKYEFYYILKLFQFKEIRKVLKETEGELESKIIEFNKDKEDLNRRIKEVYSALKESGKEKECLNENIEELSSSLEKSQKEHIEVSKLIEIFKDEKENLNRIIKEIYSALKETKHELKSKVEEFSKEKKDLDRKNDEVNRMFKKSEKEKDDANKTVVILEDEKEHFNQNIKELSNTVKKFQKENEQSSIRADILQDEKERLNENIKELYSLSKNLKIDKQSLIELKKRAIKNIQLFYLLQKKHIENNNSKISIKYFIQLNRKKMIEKEFQKVPLNIIELFDEKEYLKVNSDVEKAILNRRFDNGLEHFIFFGFREIKNGKRKIKSSVGLYQPIENGTEIEKNSNYYNFLKNVYKVSEESISKNIDEVAGLKEEIEKRKKDKGHEKYLQKTKEKVAMLTEKIVKKKIDKSYITIKNSELFDSKFYKETYSVSKGIDLIEHYLDKGEQRGNKPNALFDPIWYLAKNTDVKNAKMSPLLHYIKYGEREGRSSSTFFDPKWYLKTYTDVEKAKMSPLLHCLKYGKKEGRINHKSSVGKYNASDRKVDRHMIEWDKNREEHFIRNITNSPIESSSIFVSIIMPTYNREDTIRKSILSVLNQTYGNFELLIADDGSMDCTKDIVEEFRDKRIKYLYQENKGVSAARNLGLKEVGGEYIFFIDSDNHWKSEYLNYMISFMENNQLKSAYSAIALTDDFISYKGYLGQDYDLFSLQKQNFIDLNCFAYKNSGQNYLFDETIGRLVDWDFILTIALDVKIYYAPFIGVEYFTGDSHARITNTVVTTGKEFLKLKTYIQHKNIDILKNKIKNNSIEKIDKIAIVFHLFEYKSIHNFLEFFKDISYPFDLYITTTLSSENIIFDEIRESFPLVSILEYLDYGSDMEAFLYLFPTLKHYRSILKLHNNSAETIPFEVTKRIIEEDILGDKEHIIKIINSFENHRDLSIIGSKALYIDSKISEDEKKGLKFIGKDEKLLSLDCGYFASSVFWINIDSLSHLFDYTIEGISSQNEFLMKSSAGLLKKFVMLSIASKKDSQIGLVENKKISLSTDYNNYLDMDIEGIIEDASENYLKFAGDIEKGRILFFPDYRITNPYQKLMYDSLDSYFNIDVGDIGKALAEQKDLGNKIVFHLQWTSFIVNGGSKEEVQESVNLFLERIQTFIKNGGTVVWTIHNLISHDGKFKDIEIELCKKLAESVHYIHVHSKEIQHLVEPFYTIPDSKVLIGEHGSYVGTYPNSITKNYAQKKLKLDENSFVFLFLGQIRPYKGVESLVSAFLKLERDKSLKGKNIKLIIAGKPVNYDIVQLEKQTALSDNIQLELREIPDEELQLFFNVADFVVTPYKQILTSGSIYLALSYGVPIISPKKGIITEVLEDDMDAFLYDSNNSNSLFKAMKKSIFLSKSKLLKFKENASKKSKKLTWNSMHKQLSKAFLSSIIPNTKIEKLELLNGVRREILIRRAEVKQIKVDVGVVILHYKHTDDTIRAIESVLEQIDVNFHLYVVSNDENIDAFIQLSNRFKDITTIQSPDNIGYAGGNNIALDLMYRAKIPYGLILNPDAVLPSGELASLYQRAVANPEVGIMGPSIVYGDEPDKIWFSGATINFKNGLETEHLNMGKDIDSLSKTSFNTDYVTGACILMKLDIISKIGLIPEEYFLYFEETDYCLSATRHNISLKVFPEIKVLHFKRSEEGGIPSLYYLYYFSRNVIIMTLKYNKEKVNLTEERVQEKAKLWLKRIESISPKDLDSSLKAITYGIADGLKGITGKIDLTLRLSQ